MSHHVPEVGEYIKVWLPGETPWAECVSLNPDGSWQGRIANHLFAQRSEFERTKIAREWFPGSPAKPLPSLHVYKQDQVVTWFWHDDGTGARWMPAELTLGPNKQWRKLTGEPP